MVNSSNTLAATFQVFSIANHITSLKISTPNTRHGNSICIYSATLQSSFTRFSPQSTGLISVNSYVVSKSCVSTPSYLTISKKHILCFAPGNRSLSYFTTNSSKVDSISSVLRFIKFFTLSLRPFRKAPHMLCSVGNEVGNRKPWPRDIPAIAPICEFVL